MKTDRPGCVHAPRPVLLMKTIILLEEQLEYLSDVVTAVHPCVTATRIHCLVVDSSVLEVLLKLERRLVEEV